MEEIEESVGLKEALDNLTTIEEEIMGKIRAFSILIDPFMAEKIWEAVKCEDSCSPILMSERWYQEEKVLREKHKQDMEEERRNEEKRMQDKISKAEETRKIKGNNAILSKSWEKIKKQTKRLKNDFSRWSGRKAEELGNEVQVGLLSSKELLKEIEEAKNSEFEMAPFTNEESRNIC